MPTSVQNPEGGDGQTPVSQGTSEDDREFLERQALRLKRSQVTRFANKATEFAVSSGETQAQLKIGQRLAVSLDQAFNDMSEAFRRLTTVPSVIADRTRLENEFEKHDEYTEKVEEATESLSRRIDELFEILGPRTEYSHQSNGEFVDQTSGAPVDGGDPSYPADNEIGYDHTGGETNFSPQVGVDVGIAQGLPTTSSPQPETGTSSTPQPIYLAQNPATIVPKFNGDPVRWEEFWHLFSYYVDSKSLETTEKCRILKNCLVGKAARAVFHLKICAENYVTMKEIVQKEFKDPTQARRTHIRRINELCRAKDLHRDDKLLEFVISLKQHVHSLIALGHGFEALSTTLSPTILEALPRKYVKRFSAIHADGEGDSDRCELEALFEFLVREADLIRKCERISKGHDSSSSPARNRNPGSGSDQKLSNVDSKPEYNQRSQYSFASSVGNVDHSCIFCAKDHPSLKCTKKMSPEERRKCADAKNACLRCLRRNHTAQKCRMRLPNCSNCNGRHSQLVCTRARESSATGDVVVASPCVPLADVAAPSNTLLQTGYVWIMASKKRKVICRAILDPGSQVSLVSQKIVKLLNLAPVSTREISFHGVAGSVSSGRQLDLVKFKVRSRFSRSSVSVQCLTVPKVIEGTLPRASLTESMLELADAKGDGFPDEVDLLLGSDVLPFIYHGMYKKIDNLIAQPTIFGWFIWGNDGVNQFANSVVTSVGVVQTGRQPPAAQSETQLQKSKETLEALEFLWDTELLGVERVDSDEETISADRMDQFFRKTIKRNEEGRYIVTLPFRDNLGTLGDNRKLAYSRLIHFLKQASKSPKLLTAVDAEIKRYVAAGYAEPAGPRQPGEQAHYLPLLAVAKKALAASPVFKVRVVKDGGSRSADEASLNDVMEQGPSLLPCVIKVLFNFRRKPIVLNTDIHAAFMQFLIAKNQRTYLRFFWPLGVSSDPEAPIVEFWSTVLDFGIVAAPWLACAGIRYHLDSEIAAQPLQASLLQEVKETFYMDDVSVGARSALEAKKAVEVLVNTFRRGHFPLGKWATNSAEVANFIAEFTGTSIDDIACGRDNVKFLGVPWDQVSDNLFIDADSVKQTLRAGSPTKRRLLKGLSGLFDPLGIIAPIAISFKILCQAAWQAQVDWDSAWDGELAERYAAAVSNLEFVKDVRIERCMWPRGVNSTVREIHIFADASMSAYACVAYLREYVQGDPFSVSVRFLFAKARVAPLKGKYTIHRLELCAAALSASVIQTITALIPERVDKVVYYTDNSAVLHWIREPRPDRWKTFIANRVRQIQRVSDPASWHYIRTAENPSDLASRGSPLDTTELRRLWLYGPRWLETLGESVPHTLNSRQELTPECAAERKTEIVSAAAAASPSPLLVEKKISSWPKAVRILAYSLRFSKAARKQAPPVNLAIDAVEFQEAEIALVRNIQHSHFHAELASEAREVAKSSPLHQLRPFVGEDGLLRCRSRLEKSSHMSFDERFPVLLPYGEHLVHLLIAHIHSADCLHTGGVANILHHLRAKYFVLRARSMCRSAIASCKTCVKFNAKPAALPVPPLPAFRIEESAPFTVTGIDFLGPIWIKQGGERIKSFVLLLTCAVTRAIRLELVADLTTYEFLLALRRFISRNPAVRRLVSDNARTFKRAEKELDLLFKHARKPEVSDLLTRKRVEWQYGTEKAAWANGFFERCVQTVKRPLRKVLGTHALSFRELETVLTEIEKVVNDRPISAVVMDPSEPRALSPANLLYGYQSQAGLPDTKKLVKDSEAASAIVFSDRWRKQQSILRAFWKQFHNDYLQYLRSNHYSRNSADRPLRVGDVCLLHSGDSSRSYWPLCIVESLHGGEGTDRRQRSCWIRTAQGQRLRRPIQLLYPLEVRQF